MTTNHTKGKWGFNNNSECVWIETDDESESKIICTLSNNDKVVNNAKLIASAPELLKNLIKVKEYWGNGYEPKENCEETKGSILWKEIDKVIKKATK